MNIKILACSKKKLDLKCLKITFSCLKLNLFFTLLINIFDNTMMFYLFIKNKYDLFFICVSR